MKKKPGMPGDIQMTVMRRNRDFICSFAGDQKQIIQTGSKPNALFKCITAHLLPETLNTN